MEKIHAYKVSLGGSEQGLFRTKFDALMFIANWRGGEALTSFEIEEVFI